MLFTEEEEEEETEGEEGEGSSQGEDSNDPNDVTDGTDPEDCFSTQQENFPWWRVDLGDTRNVVRVEVEACVNPDIDAPAEFVVAVTDLQDRPTAGTDLEEDGYHNCGQYLDEFSTGETASVKCDEVIPGRFVYVYLPREDQLNIKRVRVYVQRQPGMFQ